MADTLTVTAPADFHVHLRQGTFAELVTKHVRQGGFGLAYVMVCCRLSTPLFFLIHDFSPT